MPSRTGTFSTVFSSTAGRGGKRGSVISTPVFTINFLTGTLDARVTFSRLSAATRVDSTGVLAYAPNNLLLNSGNFGATGWSNAGLAVANGVSDPFAGTAAQTLTATGSPSYCYQTPAYLPGKNINSIYVRRRTGVGAVTLTATGNTDTTIAVTGTWQRFSIPSTSVGSGGEYFNFKLAVSGDAVDVYQPLAEQVTYQTTAGTYNASAPALAYYGPQFDYSYTSVGTVLGLLIEPSRTNLVLYNNDFTSGSWVKTNCTAALTATGPDGVANSASTLTTTAASATALQTITSASSARATQCWIKRRTGSGVVSMTQDGATYTAVTVTAGWTLVAIPSATVVNPIVGFNIATSGDAIDVAYVQCETGAVSTSTIRTQSAAFTRSVDSASIIIPAGIGHITYTFDNGSTQTVAVSPGSYTIPTTLNRSRIASLAGAA
jgi:hypothetical protein